VNLCLATEKTLRAYRDSQITLTNNAIETAERNYGRATALRVNVAFMLGDSESFIKEDKQEKADERLYSSRGIPDNGYRQQLADSIKVAREHTAKLEAQHHEASDCLADLGK